MYSNVKGIEEVNSVQGPIDNRYAIRIICSSDIDDVATAAFSVFSSHYNTSNWIRVTHC